MHIPVNEFIVPKEKLRGPRIAILSRAMFSYHTKVVWGFLKALEAQVDFNWRPILFFCKEPNVGVMTEQMHEIKEDDYDLVISVGALYSHIAAEHVRNNILKTPLIFSGVTDPVQIGILPNFMPQNLITGVVREQIPHTYLADFLFAIKPTIRHVLIPHYPDGEFGFALERLHLLRVRFAHFNIEVTLLPVTAMSEVMLSVRKYIAYVDTIIIPEGVFITDLTTALAKLCQQYKVTLVGHNLERAGDNPSITFAQNTEMIGHAAFGMAKQILIDGTDPINMPLIQLPNDRKIIVDINACAEQGVDVDAITLFCSHNNIMFENTVEK